MKNLNFKIGYYFDLYSNNNSDWEAEFRFNESLTPEFIEIMLEYPNSLKNIDYNVIEYFKENYNNIPITTHAPTFNLSLLASNEYVRKASLDELYNAVDVSEKLGSKLLTFHIGVKSYLLDLNEMDPVSLIKDQFSCLALYARNKGVKLAVENMGFRPEYPRLLDELSNIFDKIDNLYLALDTRHCKQAGICPTDTFKKFSGITKSIQFRYDGSMSDLETREFIDTLVEYNYQGNFIIEDQSLTGTDKENKKQILAGKNFIDKYLYEK